METANSAVGAVRAVSLQWSHDFSVMETWLFILFEIDLYPASMEPRLFSHGNSYCPLTIVCDQQCFNGATTFQSWKHCHYRPGSYRAGSASMEPRLFSHGNDVSGTGHENTRPLQWSHDFSVMETSAFGVHGGEGTGFNGATTFQSWKLGQPEKDSDPARCFNGATTFQSWKRVGLHSIHFRTLRFNGATTFQSWKLKHQ